MGKPETKVSDLCQELNISRQTTVSLCYPAGDLRPDAYKRLAEKGN